MNRIYTQHTVTVTELKRGPSAVMEKSGGKSVAVLANNTPKFYMVDAAEYEEMMQILEVFQRGNAELKTIPSSFQMSKDRMAEVSRAALEQLMSGGAGEFAECL